MNQRWGLAAVGGVVAPILLWVALVPWDLSTGSTSRIVAGICGAVLAASVVGGGVAFADRSAGLAYDAAAFLSTLSLFMAQSIAAHDVLWPFTLLVLALVALGGFVVAFAVGRFLRTGPTMVTAPRKKPPKAVQAVVWVGLAILLGVTGAFVWSSALIGVGPG